MTSVINTKDKGSMTGLVFFMKWSIYGIMAMLINAMVMAKEDNVPLHVSLSVPVLIHSLVCGPLLFVGILIEHFGGKK